MGEGLKRARKAARDTRKKKASSVRKLESKCDMCGASFIMGKKFCVGCGQEFP